MVSALPAELVRRILELVYERWRDDVTKATLCAASLVCRQWLPEAQAVMYEDVFLGKKSAAEKFIVSAKAQAQGKRKVGTLHLMSSGKEKFNTSFCNKVLDVCTGIKQIQIMSVKGMNASLLYHSALADLRILRIHLNPAWNVKKMAQIPATAPYTSLVSASLSCYSFEPSHEIIRPLFVAAQNTLTKLQVTVNHSTVECWTELLPLVAPRIRYFRIMIDSTTLPLAFLPLLTTLTSLETFHYHLFAGHESHVHIPQVLAALPPIKTLQLEADRSVTADHHLQALAQPCAAGLETFGIVEALSKKDCTTFKRVTDECARRGIRYEVLHYADMLD